MLEKHLVARAGMSKAIPHKIIKDLNRLFKPDVVRMETTERFHQVDLRILDRTLIELNQAFVDRPEAIRSTEWFLRRYNSIAASYNIEVARRAVSFLSEGKSINGKYGTEAMLDAVLLIDVEATLENL